MYYNLLENKSHYGKFIHFGSGAEQHNTFYGLSKKVISESINGHHNFYNIRIYAVFDENELDSRYIKTNLKKYLNKDKINIFQNKFMDFFYMGDLIKLVEYYLTNNNLPKEVDCTYNKTLNLFNIAEIINSLDSHSVKIHIVNPIFGKDYKGTYTSLNLNYIGLKQGIINTYNKLKNEY